MSCILRVEGREFDVDSYLHQTKFQPSAIFRKGALKGVEKSAIHITVSNALPSELPAQFRDALQFLKTNRDALTALKAFRGVEILYLDFSILAQESKVEKYTFSPDLLYYASSIGIGIEVTRFSKKP
jgi:hypothetical protein